jgi:hypothetical protein
MFPFSSESRVASREPLGLLDITSARQRLRPHAAPGGLGVGVFENSQPLGSPAFRDEQSLIEAPLDVEGIGEQRGDLERLAA